MLVEFIKGKLKVLISEYKVALQRLILVIINLLNLNYNFNLFSTQFNHDESMEWEDIIEANDIVEKVNNKIFFINLIFSLFILKNLLIFNFVRLMT